MHHARSPLCALVLAACGQGTHLEPSSPVAADADGDGVPAPSDCDDANPEVHPGAPERCDGIDNDCDSLVDDEDEAIALDSGRVLYVDADGDGHGDADGPRRVCTDMPGLVADDTDCADDDPAIHPAAAEVCDTVDNDCDGRIDDRDDNLDPASGQPGFIDADSDGHGDPSAPTRVCELGPATGTSPLGDDCDDEEPAASPSLGETCGDGIDNDCSGDALGCGLLRRTDSRDSDLTISMTDAIGASLGTVTVISDHDADGFTDLLVTAPAYRATPTAELTPARLWIPGPLSAGVLSLPDGLDAPEELILDELASADSGIPAGDLDGDGRADLGMAWGDPWSVTGEARLISGAPDAQQIAVTADRGVSLSELGDIDGDGFADVAVGTPWDSSWYGEMPGASNGGVHLLFGDAALFDSSGSIRAADGVSVLGESNMTTHEQWIPGEAGSVTSLDHDGDGVRDLLMGAPNTGFHSAGTLAVMAGPHAAADPDRVFTDAADVLWIGTTAGAGMGGSVAAGDLNDDGYDDAVSGERTAGGLTYVFHGSASAAGTHDAWTRRDVLLTGSEDGGEGFLGASRSIADIDGDGIPELILLDERSPYGGASGAFGFRELSESATLGHEDATMHLLGQGSTAGCAAGPLRFGDMNADGVQDIILSCISEPAGGQVHVFFGLMD